jgi:hypothetical protein
MESFTEIPDTLAGKARLGWPDAVAAMRRVSRRGGGQKSVRI